MKKTCFYEVLQINRDADPDVIKKAYRKLALLYHPDKNPSEDAKGRFQAITEAHEVLSDPNEKAWYDSHRDQILRGQEPGETRDFVDELMKYFSTSSFQNIYDDAPLHFFRVYDHVFTNIAAFEDHEFPCFGNSKLDDERLLAFYRLWAAFSTSREFSECDKWNLAQAESRQVKRAMEAENKKARTDARKEFSDTVRKLVDFVKKRDPRLTAYRERKAVEDINARAREVAAKAEAKARKQADREVARAEEERRWQEVAELKRNEGESESDDQTKDKTTEIFECLACRKSFKSEKMFQTHEQSKKHKDTVAAIFKELGLPRSQASRPDSTEKAPTVVSDVAVEPVTQVEVQVEVQPDAEISSEEASEPESPVLKTERNKMKREQMKQALLGGQAEAKKKPRRRKDKTEGKVEGLCCITCKEKFASKTALFKHLSDSGHAAPK